MSNPNLHHGFRGLSLVEQARSNPNLSTGQAEKLRRGQQILGELAAARAAREAQQAEQQPAQPAEASADTSASDQRPE